MKNIPVLPLEPPIEWITIPAGKVTIEGAMFGYIRQGDTRTFDVDSFHISKHPITNAQFARFIAAGGYSKPLWWTESGWLIKERAHWQYPEDWALLSSSPSSPVMGVSWFEAVAFCLWLNAITGTSIMLPTEQEWQRAAESVGPLPSIEFDSNIVEWSATELNSGQAILDLNSTRLYQQYLDDPDDDWTTPVMQASNYVLRGGSWSEAPVDLSTIFHRRWYQPKARLRRLGFRIVYS